MENRRSKTPEIKNKMKFWFFFCTVVIIIKGLIEKLKQPGWKLIIFAWFKFAVCRKQKSSNPFAFGEEEFSAKKKVGGEKKFPFYPNWQIWNHLRYEAFIIDVLYQAF